MISRHVYLKTVLLRKLHNRLDEAESLAKESLAIDRFDFGSGNELFLILTESGAAAKAIEWLQELAERMRNDDNNHIETALDYGRAGFYKESIAVLERIASFAKDPNVFYYLACIIFIAETGRTP